MRCRSHVYEYMQKRYTRSHSPPKHHPQSCPTPQPSGCKCELRLPDVSEHAKRAPGAQHRHTDTANGWVHSRGARGGGAALIGAGAAQTMRACGVRHLSALSKCVRSHSARRCGAWGGHQVTHIAPFPRMRSLTWRAKSLKRRRSMASAGLRDATAGSTSAA